MKKAYLVTIILLLALGITCFVLFEIVHFSILEDQLANKFLTGFISRFSLALFFGWLLFLYGGKDIILCSKNSLVGLAWALPCFMVAFVNYPYTAIANGTATIDRKDLIGLYALYIVGIALLEEIVFRGIILMLAKDYFKNKRHAPLLITIICASIFSLFHLTNLFSGADVGYTLLQCVYTFLIGAMLTVTMLKLNNVWLCFVIHAIFDFCGLIVIHLGSGNAWDTVFWILTITSGVLCAGHIIYSLIKLEKSYVSRD